jgi:tyrosyl-tRNA synthetase
LQSLCGTDHPSGHGPAALDAALKASAILFGAEIGDTTETTFNDVVGEIPTTALPALADWQTGKTLPLLDALVLTQLAPSKGQARKDIEGGGVYVNNLKVTDITRALALTDLLFGKHVLLRKGKRTYAVITLT